MRIGLMRITCCHYVICVQSVASTLSAVVGFCGYAVYCRLSDSRVSEILIMRGGNYPASVTKHTHYTTAAMWFRNYLHHVLLQEV